MKTIKKHLNLYTKYIQMGWGPVYFQNLQLLSLQVTYNTGTRCSMNKMQGQYGKNSVTVIYIYMEKNSVTVIYIYII